MKHWILIISIFWFFSLRADTDHVPGELILQFKDDVQPAAWVEQYPEVSLELTERLSERLKIWLVQFDPLQNEKELLSRLKRDPSLLAVQFNHFLEKRSLVPSDSLFSVQWNLRNNSNSGDSKIDADIDADEAWALDTPKVVSAYGDTLVIAVIDGSFDIHEEINYFKNWNEIPGNNIDDDGNGFIDDFDGWNSSNNTGNVFSPSGLSVHANLVSGIAAAKGNDTTGIAGVHWGVHILPIYGQSSLESVVVKAYDYVLEMRKLYEASNGTKGAFIVATNNSFGVDSGKSTDYPIWCSMYDSMGNLGILSVAALANINIDSDVHGDMPGSCASEFLITVTNTNFSDERQNNSGFGKQTVDLGAPGTAIMSTGLNTLYRYQTGCSMASPHVAGTISYLLSAADSSTLQAYYDHPDSLALKLKEVILNGTDNLPSLKNISVTGGRLNLFKSLVLWRNYMNDDCQVNYTLDIVQESCFDAGDGSITINSPDLSLLEIQWSTRDTTSFIDSLSNGYYNVLISTDSCTLAESIILESKPEILLNNIDYRQTVGTERYQITIVASGGAGVLSYSIDGQNYISNGFFGNLDPGFYTIYVKDGNNCIVTDFVGTSITSIGEEINGQPISIFPNPFADQMTITGLEDLNAPIHIQLIDGLGRTVKSSKLSVTDAQNHLTFSTSELAAGLYYLTIQSGWSSTSIKVLKSR